MRIKLDDSGKDVVWQALKYVSYCSALTQREIIEIYQNYLNKKGLPVNAEDKIIDYLENENFSLNTGILRELFLLQRNLDQRLRVLFYGYDQIILIVQCIKVVPYMWNQNLIIDVDKIIPVPEIEKFTIRVSSERCRRKEKCYNSKYECRSYIQNIGAKLLECAKSRDFFSI